MENKGEWVKKIFAGFVIASAVVYVFFLYHMLFRLPGRQMVITSESMLENYNYWNSVNLIPFKTIAEYITTIADGSIRGHAIRNLGGNLLLLFPIGFYLPFFVQKMSKFWLYSVAVAAGIIAIEIVQVLTRREVLMLTILSSTLSAHLQDSCFSQSRLSALFSIFGVGRRLLS
jgi:glycopeptide antibiotics resistance protein